MGGDWPKGERDWLPGGLRLKAGFPLLDAKSPVLGLAAGVAPAKIEFPVLGTGWCRSDWGVFWAEKMPLLEMFVEGAPKRGSEELSPSGNCWKSGCRLLMAVGVLSS